MRRLISGVAIAAVVLLGGSSWAGAANNSEQVVFSTKPQFVGGTLNQPLGFWVWCEADSSNPYQGFCNGSFYFYELGHTEHVTGTIAEPVDGTYVMSLSSAHIDCTLTNQTDVSGPHNDITVDCTSPVSGSGTASGAVVNVTGP